MASRLLCIPLVSTLVLAAGAAHAADWLGYASAGPSAAEAGVGYTLTPSLSLRAGIGRQDERNFTRGVSGTDYRAHPEATNTFGLMLDWLPMTDSGLRLTGGLMVMQDSSLSLNQTGAGGARINGQDYPADAVGTLSGRTRFSKVAPYLGIGWQSAPATQPGFRFVGDLGLRLDLRGRTTLASSAGPSNAALQQDLEAERRKLNDEFGGTRFHLGAKVGIAYTF